MMFENTYITEIQTGEGLFAGENISAKTFEEAESLCPPYAKVVGKLMFVFNDFEFN